jgi:predicted ester cyclase
MATSNADTIRKIEEAWDAGRLDEPDQFFASEFDNSASATPGLPPGLAGAKMAHQGVMQSFPDRKLEVIDIVDGGDRVFVRTRVTGTNTGGFPAFAVPPNGNRFEIEAWSVYRFEDGKVVEHCGMNDALTLLMQLGAIPAPAGP